MAGGAGIAQGFDMDQRVGGRRRVIIVDDEVRVVDALRKALYQYRARWQVTTATSAREALAHLEAGCDAIITDMRMPEMDGEALLREVAERSPATLRVVLTGEVGAAGVEKVQRLAHHFVPKPARAPLLFARVEDALEARDRLESPALQALVCRLGALPALPGTFARINQLAERESATLDDFVHAVEGDPAVCGNVLRSVNSAWFGLSRRVASLREAVSLLGTRPLRSLVLATELFSASGQLVERLRARALERLGAVSALVARLGCPALRDEAATAAVLADVGQLLLVLRLPEEMAALLSQELPGASRVVTERRLFGADHAVVGAVLLRLWNLPAQLVEAVASHHSHCAAPSADLRTLLALTVLLQDLKWAPADAQAALVGEARPLAAAFGCDDLDGLQACFR